MQISTDIFTAKCALCGKKATVVTDNSSMLNIKVNIYIIVFFSLIFYQYYATTSGLVRLILVQHFFRSFHYLVEIGLRGARNKSVESFTSSVNPESSIHTGAQYF